MEETKRRRVYLLEELWLFEVKQTSYDIALMLVEK